MAVTENIDAIIERIRAEAAKQAQPERQHGGPSLRAVSIPAVAMPTANAPAPNQASYRLSDFYGLDEVDFLDAAYAVVLGRPLDSVGRSTFLPALRSGVLTQVGVLGSLRWSAEGRARKTQIRNLLPAFAFDRLSRMRVIGHLVAPLVQIATLPGTVRRLERRLASVSFAQRELIASINGSVRRSLLEIDAQSRTTSLESDETRKFSQETRRHAEDAVSELNAARSQILTQTRHLLGLSQDLQAVTPKSSPAAPKVDALATSGLDELYVAFENRFRGSPEAISERAVKYLKLIQNNAAISSGKAVLDIGCGRGEWLSLLKSRNVPARGIDMNAAMVAEARSRGHEVVEGDAIDYLRTLPAGSLGGITGFHIIEHIPFARLVALFDAANRALAPGGMVLFETPNPEGLVVGSYTFNFDPTHIKPLAPSFTQFIAENRGYRRVRIIRTPDDCDLDAAPSAFDPQTIEDWFKQPPDYALYAETGSPDSGAALA